jgi:hypothetical protein
MVLDLLSSLSRSLVPIPLAVALGFFIVLSLRSKSIRSLQMQLSIFLIIWVGAELLRSLSVLGIISSNPTSQLIGLMVHTVSMVVFGLVISTRFLKYFRGELTVSSKTFSRELETALHAGLTEVLGEPQARAVHFYVDRSLAVSHVDAYMDAIRKIFGDGADTLEQKIAEKLYSNLELDFVGEESRSLAEYVADARRRKTSS